MPISSKPATLYHTFQNIQANNPFNLSLSIPPKPVMKALGFIPVRGCFLVMPGMIRHPVSFEFALFLFDIV
jgi:hypothetical protein